MLFICIRDLQIMSLLSLLPKCQKFIDIDRTLKLLKLFFVFKIYESHITLKVFSLFHLDFLLSIDPHFHMGSLIFWNPIVENLFINIDFMRKFLNLIVEFRVLRFHFALENCLFDMFR
jgi:hypothetical protein